MHLLQCNQYMIYTGLVHFLQYLVYIGRFSYYGTIYINMIGQYLTDHITYTMADWFLYLGQYATYDI